MKARIPNSTQMREKQMEELLKHQLGPDDTFQFRCAQCGKCCRNRNDILLSPFDICRIAKHTGESVEEVIGKYGLLYIGDTSKVPLVMLKMRKDTGECPFLKDNRCSIHMGKPAVCALFPLGRVAMRDKENTHAIKLSYVLQPVTCGAKDETHTPREWMTGFDLAESEQYFNVWQDTVMEMSEGFKKYIHDLPKNAKDGLYRLMASIMYGKYDPNEPLMPQFEEKRKLIMGSLAHIERGLNEELSGE